MRAQKRCSGMGSTLFDFWSLLPCATLDSSACTTRSATVIPARTPISADSASGYLMPPRATGMELVCMILRLHLDHIKIALGGGAYRTNPVVGNVGPSGAGREALIRIALCLVIDVAAGPALPGFVGLIAHRDRPCSAGFRDGAKLSQLLDGWQ